METDTRLLTRGYFTVPYAAQSFGALEVLRYQNHHNTTHLNVFVHKDQDVTSKEIV